MNRKKEEEAMEEAEWKEEKWKIWGEVEEESEED